MCGISFVDLHPVSPAYNPSAYLRSYLVLDVMGDHAGTFGASYRKLIDRPEFRAILRKREERLERKMLLGGYESESIDDILTQGDQAVIERERRFAACAC